MHEYTRDDLMKQASHIVSEINLHHILDICNAIYDVTHMPIVKFNRISALREELKTYLEEFIDSHLENKDILRLYYNHKWEIGFSYEYDVEKPHLYATFKYEVEEMCAGGFDEVDENNKQPGSTLDSENISIE